MFQCLLTAPCSAPSQGSWMLSQIRISLKHRDPQDRSGGDETSGLKKPHNTFETRYHLSVLVPGLSSSPSPGLPLCHIHGHCPGLVSQVRKFCPSSPQLFLPPGTSPALSGFHIPCLHFSGTQMTRIANTIPKGTLAEICGTA